MKALYGHFRHNNADTLHGRRVHVFNHVELVSGGGRGHTVVAYQGLGETQNLALVREIRQELRVIYQLTSEEDLSAEGFVGAERVAVENRAVLDGECSYV